ncbi:septum site-determining protein Ssd [Kineosporia succinea]|uniref:Secretion/DNA translocation related CpaE-like protein n=1 Tax=Kineosporia succinea TaxID=84632 RepID=A0ABT9P0T8_9ACTN|nr:septum site-determining protein Ssd [Kineosporia succinea]MDP9826034.1 secretion/DNA translocation related CpaE-like protein [Kineosporia succinea]
MPESAQLRKSVAAAGAAHVVRLPQAGHRPLVVPTGRWQGLVVGVVGGCGGAGASVLAAALARTAASPQSRAGVTLLAEIDQLGGGLDLLLGAEDEPGLRWPDLASARGRLLPGSLSGTLPVIDGVHVLAAVRSGPVTGLSAAAVQAVLDAARSEYGLVVLDLPRHLDEAARAAVRAAHVCLVVVPADVRATAAARRVVASLRPEVDDVRVVVREPGPAGIAADGICAALDLPLAGLLPTEPRLRLALDRGEPPGLRPRGPLAAFCRELLEELR